jgi:hypothetical protein
MDEKILAIMEYMKSLTTEVGFNTMAIDELAEFNQTVGIYLLQLTDLVRNNLITMKGGFIELIDELQILELAQDAQFELLEAIQTLTYFNTGHGVLNTVLIFALAIFVIRRK